MYAIIRQMKIKNSGDFNGSQRHNLRIFNSKNIDQTRSHKNIFLQNSIYPDYDEFVKSKRDEIRKKNFENGTKNRMVRKTKNKKTGEMEFLSMVQEFIFTHSPGAMSENESIEFLKMADKFLKSWFGEEIEVISSVIHLDEATPHLHFTISYFDKNRGKFCQSELQKQGKTDISNIRSAWQKHLSNTRFSGLQEQDGSVKKGENHNPKASAEAKMLRERIGELEEQKAYLGKELAIKTAQIGSQSHQINEKELHGRIIDKLQRASLQQREAISSLGGIAEAAGTPAADDYRAIEAARRSKLIDRGVREWSGEFTRVLFEGLGNRFDRVKQGYQREVESINSTLTELISDWEHLKNLLFKKRSSHIPQKGGATQGATLKRGGSRP
jgi:hypothetical protein